MATDWFTAKEKGAFPSGKRYRAFAPYCRETFGGRIVKIPLASGFSCPNRDGSRGTGGCTFCTGDGGGEFAPRAVKPLNIQWEEGLRQNAKWPDALAFGYFQAFSATHASVEAVDRLLEQAIVLPGIRGLRLATRADCISDEMADLLAQYAQRIPLQVELGLQTAQDETAYRINRCHDFEEFCAGFTRLRSRGIYCCVHLINGLPGECKADMLNTMKKLAAMRPDGVKIHMLHLLKGSALSKEHEESPLTILSQEEYIDIVCDQLALLPPETVIERLTGDGARQNLIAPLWTLDKRRVLNAIDQELSRRNSWQGKDWRETP